MMREDIHNNLLAGKVRTGASLTDLHQKTHIARASIGAVFQGRLPARYRTLRELAVVVGADLNAIDKALEEMLPVLRAARPQFAIEFLAAREQVAA